MQSKIWQVLNLLGFLVMIAANYAANAVPLNDMDTGAVSELYPNLFTPAGFTFSIWGLIYILLLAFCIYQARGLFSSSGQVADVSQLTQEGQKRQKASHLQSIGPLFFISCLLNAGWIFAWHYLQIGLSLLIMVALLLVLIKIYLNLGIGVKEVSRAESFLVNLPFQVYLGWITIATVANVTALLVHLEWDAFGIADSIWTVVVIAVAMLIILGFLQRHRDLPIALVAIWSFVGILVKNLDREPMEMPVVVAAIAAIVIIGIFAGFRLPKSLEKYTES